MSRLAFAACLPFRAWAVVAAAVFFVGLSAGLRAADRTDKASLSNEAIRPFSQGYLFVNNQFIQSPYEFSYEGDNIVINDVVIDPARYDLSGYQVVPNDEGPARRRGGFARWRRDAVGFGELGPAGRRFGGGGPAGGFRGGAGGERRSGPIAAMFREISNVRFGDVAVLYEGQKPLLLNGSSEGTELVRELLHSEARKPGRGGRGGTEPADADIHLTTVSVPGDQSMTEDELRERLVAEFVRTPEFRAKAEWNLERIDAAESEGQRVMEGNYWMDQLNYPLTVFAMAIVVLGFGHLLQNRPQIEPVASGEEPVDWSVPRKVVVRSLCIVALLSVVDLIWTSASAHAGLMRELNPIGSNLISDPLRLTAFKVCVTAVSIAILYRLHRRPAAQIASWWCCLVLTLLTARWLVFQSMFL